MKVCIIKGDNILKQLKVLSLGKLFSPKKLKICKKFPFFGPNGRFLKEWLDLNLLSTIKKKGSKKHARTCI